MEFKRMSLKLILAFILLLILFSPVDAVVISVYANFEHLNNPFTQWYHGGSAIIVEENGNKVLKVSGGTSGRVIGVDIQYSSYVRLKLDLKVLNSTDGFLRMVVFGYPMSSEEYKSEREICGIYINKDTIFAFNGTLEKLTEIKEGWNGLTLNLDLTDGIASLEYGGKKYLFNISKTKGKYFIFRVDPGTEAMLDEIELKAGNNFSELFDQYTFTKATPSSAHTPAETTTALPAKPPSPTPTPQTPRFDDLKIILDKNYEVLYKTKLNSHDFYIVKYYNYLPPGTGIEVVTEKGLKIGIEEKGLVRSILNTLNVSDVEKDLLYKSWENRQNGIVTVYVTVIASLLFLLGLLAIIVWKT